MTSRRKKRRKKKYVRERSATASPSSIRGKEKKKNPKKTKKRNSKNSTLQIPKAKEAPAVINIEPIVSFQLKPIELELKSESDHDSEPEPIQYMPNISLKPKSRSRFQTMPGILMDDQNLCVLQINEKLHYIKNNISNIESNLHLVNSSFMKVKQEIEENYKAIILQLEENKMCMNEKLNIIQNRKITTFSKNYLESQIRMRDELQVYSNSIDKVLKDRELHIADKRNKMTEILANAQNCPSFVINENKEYFMVGPKISYGCNRKLFIDQLLSMDDVLDNDCLQLKYAFFTPDFNNERINVEWQFRAQYMINANSIRFHLQMMEVYEENIDVEDKKEDENINVWVFLSELDLDHMSVGINVPYDEEEKLIKNLHWYKLRIAMITNNPAINLKDIWMYSNMLSIKSNSTAGPVIDSILINEHEKKILYDWIPKSYPKNKRSKKRRKTTPRRSTVAKSMRFELIFRGSRDGFSSKTFHFLCDSKKPKVSSLVPGSPQTPRTAATFVSTPITPHTPAHATWDSLEKESNNNNGGSSMEPYDLDADIPVENTGTVCIIQSAYHKNIFGGYTSQDWTGSGYKLDYNAFIFSLRNNCSPGGKSGSAGKGGCQKWNIRKKQYGIYCSHKFGPVFGGGCDICIADNCNNNCSSYTDLRHKNSSFAAPANNYLLAGEEEFEVKDYEVFRIVYY